MTTLAHPADLWLSAVVLEELYAGATERDLEVVPALESEFRRLDRFLVPALEDWTATGAVLTGVARRYGYSEISRGRLTNDALIGISEARRGITVLTTNAKDFARIAEFFPVRWRLIRMDPI